MKTVISVKGTWNRNDTITFEVAKGTQPEDGFFVASERSKKQTTAEPVEMDTEKEYFQNMFAGQADEIWVGID